MNEFLLCLSFIILIFVLQDILCVLFILCAIAFCLYYYFGKNSIFNYYKLDNYNLF